MRNIFLASAATATLAASFISGASAVAQPRGPQGGAYGGGGAPSGSYVQSCRNIQAGDGQLTADCRDIHSRYIRSSIAYGQCRGDISSTPNGTLSCNGAVAQGGQVVDNGDDRRGQGNNDRRDNNGNFTAGIVAGALLGGALAGNAGAPPPPPPPQPPAYGDPRYGDPHFDWRYQQGGYGYGRRPGEWVPIADRADWLNRQIDALLREGRIDYRDARDYRRQLDGIQFQERDMMRYGRLGPRQRDDLDRRFNDLTEEVRHDARED